MAPVITSLLDTDLYKFTMMQCILHHFKSAHAHYRLIQRRLFDLKPHMGAIQDEINKLCALSFSESELAYLQTLPYIKKDFIDYLRNFKLNPAHVQVSLTDNLELNIDGPWLETILFEVPVLAIISEVYYRHTVENPDYSEGRNRLNQKIQFLQKEQPELKFTDFGTRRRFSHAWHREVLSILKENLPKQFDGTSNVLFAKELNLWPIGTMAHEYLQAAQVLAPNIKGSQHFALSIWLEEYGTPLSIALTDVLTMDIFLNEFDADLASRYVGLRQDSGDPIAWGEKAIQHYQSLNIPSENKIFVFSDSLNVQKAVNIFNHFKGRCRPFFGIGTNLTNDLGYTPLDIVIKMTQVNHKPVIKISDAPGKMVTDDMAFLKKVKELFQLKDA